MKRKSKPTDIGTVFAVPLSDGSSVLGQVVGEQREVLNSVTCAFFNHRTSSTSSDVPDLVTLHPIAIQFITRDLLNKRVWKPLDVRKVTVDKNLFPFEETRSKGWVGAKMIGSGIIINFLEAFFGLRPWDMMKDPAYFDRLLVSPELKPKEVTYKIPQQ